MSKKKNPTLSGAFSALGIGEIIHNSHIPHITLTDTLILLSQVLHIHKRRESHFLTDSTRTAIAPAHSVGHMSYSFVGHAGPCASCPINGILQDYISTFTVISSHSNVISSESFLPLKWQDNCLYLGHCGCAWGYCGCFSGHRDGATCSGCFWYEEDVLWHVARPTHTGPKSNWKRKQN